MSDELKAAIERQKYGLYSLSEEAKWAPQEHERELRDLKLLARAYLARLAADEQQAREDAEPITEGWLRSLDMEEHYGSFTHRCLMLGCINPACGEYGYSWLIGDVHIATFKTRGQLRKLLEALKGGVS